jgi:hypothetical protein
MAYCVSPNKPILLETVPTLLKTYLVLLALVLSLRTPRFKQTAHPNRCHKTAMGLCSVGV